MLFNSLEFLVFFPLVTIIYFLLPHRFRWFHLLISSCVFYMAFIPVYIFILIFTIIIDYFAGKWIENAAGRKRKWLLSLSIVANVGVLAIFKYYNFGIDNMNAMLNQLHLNVNQIPHLGIILPIGLSFHTFQAMSYTIEVYRGKQKAEKHFGIYSLYVMFYPQLVAGPIERPQNLLHQFREPHKFDTARVVSGLRLMMWGMFKKIVIADRLAVFVNQVYNDPNNFGGLPTIVATIFFAFQIYCDFSGYSDIAIGSARVMGFNLMQNFKTPYYSSTISEFWKRWHISLSTWFKDYLYISLGGNRRSVPRWYFNLFIVFLISGLWHGASWNFVIWGALHGCFLIAGILTKPFREKTNQFLRLTEWPKLMYAYDISLNFLLVTFAWIFFRAKTFDDATQIISGFFKQSVSHIGDKTFFGLSSVLALFESWDWYMLIIALLIMEMVQWFQQNHNPVDLFNKQKSMIRTGLYYAMLFLILFGMMSGKADFIYFQF